MEAGAPRDGAPRKLRHVLMRGVLMQRRGAGGACSVFLSGRYCDTSNAAAAAAAAVTSGPPPTARAPIRTTQSMDNEAPTIHASTISRMAYGDHRAKEIEIPKAGSKSTAAHTLSQSLSSSDVAHSVLYSYLHLHVAPHGQRPDTSRDTTNSPGASTRPAG